LNNFQKIKFPFQIPINFIKKSTNKTNTETRFDIVNRLILSLRKNFAMIDKRHLKLSKNSSFVCFSAILEEIQIGTK
jgi:tRNA A58 N-methylase Trm61